MPLTSFTPKCIISTSVTWSIDVKFHISTGSNHGYLITCYLLSYPHSWAACSLHSQCSRLPVAFLAVPLLCLLLCGYSSHVHAYIS